MTNILRFYSFVLISLFFIPAFSQADTFTVTNLNDAGAGSLRQAIVDANTNPGPDEIVFGLIVTGVIPTGAPIDNTFTAQMEITDDLTITGPGANFLTIDGQMTDRIFSISNVETITVSIKGLRFIRGGSVTGGGAILNTEVLSIDSCVFENNEATNGGAIRNEGTITEITQSVFDMNKADNGGAINNVSTIEKITQSTFDMNVANGVGGGAIHSVVLIDEIARSIFSENMATDPNGLGGAIFIGGSILKITDSMFHMNEAGSAGGAIATFTAGRIEEIARSIFSRNMADIGGAIANNIGSDVPSFIFKITHSTFDMNESNGDGGAIANASGIIDIIQSTFSGNFAGGAGGAITNGVTGFNDGIIFAITQSTFSGNIADGTSGAIENIVDSIIFTIAHSTFSQNQSNIAGAVGNAGTIENIFNSTFNGNRAITGGAPLGLAGAIVNFATMNISFTTIADNTAQGSASSVAGGIVNGASAVLAIKNSIVGDNTGGDCAGVMFTDQGNNLDSDGTCAALDTNMTFTTSAGLNLDALEDNGGPTETIALLPGSPALDGASDCTDLQTVPAAVQVDQRFFTRPFNSTGDPMDLCDIGAFEAQPIGKLTIIKESVPSGGTGFEFTGTGFPEGCELADMFTLDHAESAMCIIQPGMYTVAETPPPGVLPEISCDDGTLPDNLSSVTVDIDDGDDVTCTFTNFEPSEVKITKLAIPSSDTMFNFTSTGFDSFPPCDITPAFTLSAQQTATCLVLTDDFTITEAVPEDQILNIFCEELPAVSSIDADAGILSFSINDLSENVECTFINSPANTVVRILDELPGPNCAFGGSRIEAGLDVNQNGVLDDGEVDPLLTIFGCNGEPGGLVRVTAEPIGPNCEFGGQRIDTGLDDNRDGVLQDEEIDDTVFVCNGAPGVNTLVLVSPEPAGNNCEFGGQRVDSGADDNRNDALDPEEIDNTFFVCNGGEGPPGDDADTPIIDLEPLEPGPICPNGGVRIKTGNDTNGNGVLDDDEVLASQVICNGEDGQDGQGGSDGQDGSDGNSGCSLVSASAGTPELFGLLAPFILLPLVLILRRKRRLN